jgi:hypothetical protein
MYSLEHSTLLQSFANFLPSTGRVYANYELQCTLISGFRRDVDEIINIAAEA